MLKPFVYKACELRFSRSMSTFIWGMFCLIITFFLFFIQLFDSKGLIIIVFVPFLFDFM